MKRVRYVAGHGNDGFQTYVGSVPEMETRPVSRVCPDWVAVDARGTRGVSPMVLGDRPGNIFGARLCRGGSVLDRSQSRQTLPGLRADAAAETLRPAPSLSPLRRDAGIEFISPSGKDGLHTV